MVREFVTAVARLVVAGRWAELKEFFALVRLLSKTPVGSITAIGIPVDKPQEN